MAVDYPHARFLRHLASARHHAAAARCSADLKPRVGPHLTRTQPRFIACGRRHVVAHETAARVFFSADCRPRSGFTDCTQPPSARRFAAFGGFRPRVVVAQPVRPCSTAP